MKAHFHRASALCQQCHMGHPHRARIAAYFGLRFDPKNVALLELSDRSATHVRPSKTWQTQAAADSDSDRLRREETKRNLEAGISFGASYGAPGRTPVESIIDDASTVGNSRQCRLLHVASKKTLAYDAKRSENHAWARYSRCCHGAGAMASRVRFMSSR